MLPRTEGKVAEAGERLAESFALCDERPCFGRQGAACRASEGHKGAFCQGLSQAMPRRLGVGGETARSVWDEGSLHLWIQKNFVGAADTVGWGW